VKASIVISRLSLHDALRIFEAMVGVVAITADVGRVLGELLSVQNTERMWAGAAVLAFNHHGGSAITKNKMAVAGFQIHLRGGELDRKSTRLNSSHVTISYAV